MVWSLLIFAASSLSSIPIPKGPFSPDKIAHLVFFFILCGLAYRAFFFQGKYPWLRDHALGAAVVFTALYGVLDEVHQYYVPGRHFDVYDMVADAVGGLLFLLILKFVPGFAARMQRSDPVD